MQQGSGNSINVAIRIKPGMAGSSLAQQVLWEVRRNENILVQYVDFPDGGKPSVAGSFPFDRVFDEMDDTRVVYNQFARSIVHSSLHGFNGTIFAYGQTSSGKTFTINGTNEQPGLIRLAIKDIFSTVEQEKEAREFIIRVSYLEIYNEVITDLLNEENKNLKIHESINRDIFVGNATEYVALNEDDIWKVLEKGESSRKIGSTSMNERSSRSHTILRFSIETRERLENDADNARDSGRFVSGAVRVSTLNFVDLAGSERAGLTGAEGLRLKEGGHINKSLLALSTVIGRLAEGDERRHIPFRDSKLTRMLQPFLGGNGKTQIICTVSLAEEYVEETLSTLKFASRAKCIQNRPVINEVVPDEQVMRNLRKEVEELKRLHRKPVAVDLSALRDVKNEILVMQQAFSLLRDDRCLNSTGFIAKLKRDLSSMFDVFRAVLNERNSYVDYCAEAENDYVHHLESLTRQKELLVNDLKTLRTSYALVATQLEEKLIENQSQKQIIEELKRELSALGDNHKKQKRHLENEVVLLRTSLAEREQNEVKMEEKLAKAQKEALNAMNARLGALDGKLVASERTSGLLGRECCDRQNMLRGLHGRFIELQSKTLKAANDTREKVLARVFSGQVDFRRIMETIKSAHSGHLENRKAMLLDRFAAMKRDLQGAAVMLPSEMLGLTDKKCNLLLHLHRLFKAVSEKCAAQRGEANGLHGALRSLGQKLDQLQVQLKESVKKEATFGKIMKNLETHNVFGRASRDDSTENLPSNKRVLLPSKRKHFGDQ